MLGKVSTVKHRKQIEKEDTIKIVKQEEMVELVSFDFGKDLSEELSSLFV